MLDAIQRRITFSVAGVFIVALLVVVLLPPYFYRALIVLSPPVIGFVSIGLWMASGAVEDESGLFSTIGTLALIVTVGVLFVHLALLIFGSGLFGFRGILTTLSGMLFTVGLPVLFGGSMAYWLLPEWDALITGLIGMGAGLALVLVQAVIDFEPLTWALFLLSPLATIIQIYRQPDRDSSALWNGLIAGALAGLIASIALSVTVRVVLCLGAVDCAEQFGLAGWLLFYGVVVAVCALNVLVDWLVGSLTLLILRRL